MKKLLSVCLVLAMMICLGVTAFAEGAFVNSPSLNPAPEVEGSTEVVVTPYTDRNKLSDAELKALEAAYNSINSTENLSDLNKALNGKNLGVSDLFNLSSTSSKAQAITLKADTLKNFVALMVYVNGEWKIVEGAKVQNGKLMFTAKDFGPYAVVVDTTDDTKSPQTGINEVANTSGTSLVVYGMVMLLSACGAFLMWNKSKKYSA